MKIAFLISLLLYVVSQINNQSVDITNTVSVEPPRKEVDNAEDVLPTSFCLPVDNIMQNPELPTGCEITSLAIVFNYFGFDVDKCDLAKNYLPQGKIGQTNPNKAFVGSPFNNYSYGCYSDAIILAAEEYMKKTFKTGYNIENISGLDIEFLEKMLYNNQVPIIMWASMYMKPITKGITWKVNGETITWRSNNHCLVLIGWTETTYVFCDPLVGVCEYDKETVKQRYIENERNAILITKQDT